MKYYNNKFSKTPWWYPVVVMLKMGSALYIVAFNFFLVLLVFAVIAHPSVLLDIIIGIVLGTIIAIYKFFSENPDAFKQMAEITKSEANNTADNAADNTTENKKDGQ